MIDIALDPLPNQSVSVRLADSLYTLTIKACRGVMAIDVQRDQEYVVRGLRLVAGTPVLPYDYLEDGGNFVLLTENGEYPDYALFGISQSLLFLTTEEIAELTA